MKSTEKNKRTTVRIPVDMWKQIRRLQESGKVKSIQDAITTSLEYLIANKGDVVIKKSDTKE